jgi:hypothetical protein
MTPTNQSSQDLQNLEPTRSYLNELVGEGKRYDSPEAVARAKIFQDAHIKQIEQENARLREDYTRAREENIAKAKLEDLLDQIQGRKEPTEHKQPTVPEEKAIDYRQIESLIENKIKQTRLTDTYNQNLETVKNKLVERFGDNYTETYKQQLVQLDLTQQEADDLARRKPTTFLKMLGLDQARQPQQQFNPPPRSQTNNPQSPMPSPPEKRTWAWYENLRKTNRNAYLDSKTQVQMLQDRMELGEAFEDSGFDKYHGGTR